MWHRGGDVVGAGAAGAVGRQCPQCGRCEGLRVLCSPPRDEVCVWGGGGERRHVSLHQSRGGCTDSLSLCTNCKTTAPPPPFFWDKGQPLVLPSPKLQPPLFMDTQKQPLEIIISSIAYVIIYQIIILKKFQEQI